ncbi:MAG: HAD-IA family hydrolase [Puniceicoccales bacterium]|jgi:putative hydrolase of the HAD superfamily|nr:HAD-IA family hydrolase [Puniceicoccales bacterium]
MAQYSLQGIRVITLDVFGTLVVPNPSIGHIYARILARHRGGETDGKQRQIEAGILNKRFPKAWKQVRTTMPEPLSESAARAFWEKVVRDTYADDCPQEIFPVVFAEVYTAFAKGENWRVLPGTRQALDALRFLGYRLAAFTNADARMHHVLVDLGLGRYFEKIFTSTELGAAKPDPQAYATIASRLHVAATDVLHVGDSLREDVEGAVGAGCRAAWLAPDAHFKPAGAIVLKSLLELPDRLRFAETKPLQYKPNLRGPLKAFKGILEEDPKWKWRKPPKSVRDIVANLRDLPEEAAFGRGRRHEEPEQSIGSAILEVASQLRSEATPMEVLKEQWSKLAGKFAEACEPRRIAPGGILVIHCENAVIRSELMMKSRQMLAAIGKLPNCEKVRRLSFQF